jgi:hypothetical protein
MMVSTIQTYFHSMLNRSKEERNMGSRLLLSILMEKEALENKHTLSHAQCLLDKVPQLSSQRQKPACFCSGDPQLILAPALSQLTSYMSMMVYLGLLQVLMNLKFLTNLTYVNTLYSFKNQTSVKSSDLRSLQSMKSMNFNQ